MAKKRMFDLDVVDTDVFLEMSNSARLLYYDLGMRADDDGFVSNPRKIMKMTNASDDDLKILFLKQFVIPFENGICVIKHWKLNNYLRGDRYKATLYQDEKKLLKEDDNGVYTLENQALDSLVYQKTTNGIHSIEEKSIEENKIEYNNNIYEYLESNFGRTISPIEFEKINNWLLLFTEDMIKYGIELCVLQNKKTFSYLEGIFKNWKSKGYKLLSEAKDDRLVKKVNTPEWFNQTITRDEPEISEEKRKEIDDFVREFEKENAG